jgi:hypothetical protein
MLARALAFKCLTLRCARGAEELGIIRCFNCRSQQMCNMRQCAAIAFSATRAPFISLVVLCIMYFLCAKAAAVCTLSRANRRLCAVFLYGNKRARDIFYALDT